MYGSYGRRRGLLRSSRSDVFVSGWGARGRGLVSVFLDEGTTGEGFPGGGFPLPDVCHSSEARLVDALKRFLSSGFLYKINVVSLAAAREYDIYFDSCYVLGWAFEYLHT
jgi:hypothetical protein